MFATNEAAPDKSPYGMNIGAQKRLKSSIGGRLKAESNFPSRGRSNDPVPKNIHLRYSSQQAKQAISGQLLKQKEKDL